MIIQPLLNAELCNKPFSDVLSGKNAFYHLPNYLESTQKDLKENVSLPIAYTWNTEHKATRIAKQILSIIFFPVEIYHLLHSLVGKIALLPASSPSLMGYPKNYANIIRSCVVLSDEWKYKRIAIEVDGYKIDAMIVGKESTLENGRWVLASNGNGEFYEDKISFRNPNFKQILSKINGNAIVFNYPGVGESSGLPNRQAMAKAYRGMLSFLEDREKGIGAQQIIGYGHSIGGGVQGDALKTHKLKEGVKYVFIKSRTFSDLKTIASILTCRPLGFLVKLLGWNMDSVESSRQLQVPEIIMQTANVETYETLVDSSKIIEDGIIPIEASLAKVLLDDSQCTKKSKLFIGMPEGHNDGINDPSYLAEEIERRFKVQ